MSSSPESSSASPEPLDPIRAALDSLDAAPDRRPLDVASPLDDASRPQPADAVRQPEEPTSNWERDRLGGESTSESTESDFPDRGPDDESTSGQASDDELADDELADDELTGQFRQWLREVRAEAAAVAGEFGAREAASGGEDSEAPPAIGLYRLVEEFTALRQEIKLQARSARGLEETVARLTPELRESIEAVRRREQAAAIGASGSAGDDKAIQTLLLSLTEVDEALERGRRQVDRAAARLEAAGEGDFAARIESVFARQSGLSRWAARRFRDELLAEFSRGDGGDAEQSRLLAALRDGYELLRQRVSRLLAKEQVTRVAAVGRPVDPETMIVVEAVDAAESGVLPNAVVDEVRPGYLWKGRVLRCAEVRAARGG